MSKLYARKAEKDNKKSEIGTKEKVLGVSAGTTYPKTFIIYIVKKSSLIFSGILSRNPLPSELGGRFRQHPSCHPSHRPKPG